LASLENIFLTVVFVNFILIIIFYDKSRNKKKQTMRKLTTALLIVIQLITVDNKAYAMSLTEGIAQKAFNVITVTRNKISKYDEPLLLNEIFVLFKNIDQLLGGICFKKADDDRSLEYIYNFYSNNLLQIAAKHGSNQHITAYYSSLYSKLINDLTERNNIFESLKTSLDCSFALNFKTRIHSIFSTMNDALMQKIKTSKITGYDLIKPTLLVFQEAIFSQTHLLNDEYVNFILDLCKKLTLTYNISIHINLLHQFDNDKSPLWVYKAESTEKSVNSAAGKNTATTVANYSLIISKGDIVNIYIKTEHDDTLNDESDDLLIKENFKLKCGTLESCDLGKHHLSQFIATRICADINLLAVHPSLYDLSLNKLSTNGILIIQSNTLPLFNIKNILIKLKSDILNSYLNRFIIHCDPGKGASVLKIQQEESALSLWAYLPIDSQWPKYKEEEYVGKIRVSSGIEVDVNNESCIEQKNSKLFYINVWDIGQNFVSRIFEEKDL
jgi:hypothetical protein